MKKKTISLVALTIATAVSLSACTGAKSASSSNNKIVESTYVVEDIKEDVPTIVEEPIKESPSVVEEPKEAPSFSDSVINNVLGMNDNEPEKVALLRIINSNEDTETCINELENIFRLAIIPRCATEEEWDSVIHLRNTIGEYDNPFDVYYDLAVYVHILKCEEDHYENEFGQIECKKLRKEMSNN